MDAVEKRAQGHIGRWVTQTRFYDPSQPLDLCTGNCTEAALASLFGIRLEDVPSMQGLIGSDYWDALEAFVRSRGYELSMQLPSHRPAGLYLADGPTARGCGHFVVMRGGKMVHDPHPSGAGLLEIKRVWSLVVLDPAASLTPPEGYVLVPFEPTSEMVKAGLNAPFCGHPETGGPSLTGMWTAMLAVRPEVKP